MPFITKEIHCLLCKTQSLIERSFFLCVQFLVVNIVLRIKLLDWFK